MNKAELIEAITGRIGDKKTASAAVEAIIDTVTRAVAKGEKVGIAGFGVWEKVERQARTARNPATGATVKLKKTSVPKFRPGQGFKDVVSGAKKVAAVTGRTSTAAAKAAPASRSTGTRAAAKATTVRKATAKATGTRGATKASPVKRATKTAAAKAAPVKRATTAKATPTKRAGAKRSAAKATPAKKATTRK